MSYLRRLASAAIFLLTYITLALGWLWYDLEFHVNQHSFADVSLNYNLYNFKALSAMSARTGTEPPTVAVHKPELDLADAVVNARALFSVAVSFLAVLMLSVLFFGFCLIYVPIHCLSEGQVCYAIGSLVVTVLFAIVFLALSLIVVPIWMVAVAFALAFQSGTTEYTYAYVILAPLAFLTAGFTQVKVVAIATTIMEKGPLAAWFEIAGWLYSLWKRKARSSVPPTN